MHWAAGLVGLVVPVALAGSADPGAVVNRVAVVMSFRVNTTSLSHIMKILL